MQIAIPRGARSAPARSTSSCSGSTRFRNRPSSRAAAELWLRAARRTCTWASDPRFSRRPQGPSGVRLRELRRVAAASRGARRRRRARRDMLFEGSAALLRQRPVRQPHRADRGIGSELRSRAAGGRVSAGVRRGACDVAIRPARTVPRRGVEELREIAADADAFLERRATISRRVALRLVLPNGATVLRLPGFERWIWDGDFAGSIGLRWQLGTPELPAWCLTVTSVTASWPGSAGAATPRPPYA